MKHMEILIVDDDPNIREVLSVLLKGEGYCVQTAEDGNSAIDMVYSDSVIHLVILDVMMPGLSGIEACKIIRKKSKVPILFLTAKSQEQDKVQAYTGGGDDYLVKPFSKSELLLKVKSLLRRYTEYSVSDSVKSNNETKLSDFIAVDLKKRIVSRDGEQINLTDKEFDILEFFIKHRGKVVENKSLYESVWGERYLPSAGNTIMVHVLNLRRKIEEDVNKPNIIKTVWGKGYRID